MSLTPYNDDQSGSGKSGLLAAFIVLGMIGAGAGAGLAKYVSDYTEQEVHGRIRHQQDFAETLPFPPSTRLQSLKPLVTNLTSPKGAWIRLKAAILLEDDANGEVAILRKKVEDDFLSYLRTLSLSHLEGSIGLQHLREDLTERAKIRTKGLVHEVILESVVIQ